MNQLYYKKLQYQLVFSIIRTVVTNKLSFDEISLAELAGHRIFCILFYLPSVIMVLVTAFLTCNEIIIGMKRTECEYAKKT